MLQKLKAFEIEIPAANFKLIPNQLAVYKLSYDKDFSIVNSPRKPAIYTAVY